MSLPDPLIPVEVDLRDFVFMPLDVLRLRDSELAATPDAEAFRCAVLSWCVAWHQVPAGSLPDDDATLARLFGFGRDLKGWKKTRASDGLRGWIKCSDGRLYHPVVAEKAQEAWKAKLAQRARTEAARKAREEARQKQLHSLSQSQLQTNAGSVTEPVTASKGQGQGQGQGQVNPNPTVVDSQLPSVPVAEKPPEPGATQPAASPPAAPRGTRISASWHLPKPWGDWALQEQPTWTPEHVRKVAAGFRDYWVAKPGKDGVKLDWEATWRNWVRKEGPMRAAGQGPPNSREASRAAAARSIFGGGDGQGRSSAGGERDITGEVVRVA